jgi:hypothetical protein
MRAGAAWRRTGEAERRGAGGGGGSEGEGRRGGSLGEEPVGKLLFLIIPFAQYEMN